jgi:hypothetical protein
LDKRANGVTLDERRVHYSNPLADVVQCGLKRARLGPICHPTLP